MCDLYCSSLGPDFVQHDSGCEGFCQAESGPKTGASCTVNSDCCVGTCTLDSAACAGGSLPPPESHTCGCECIAQGVGPPSRPGTLRCELGLQVWIESAGPCDEQDISIVTEPACFPFTTEASTATMLNVNQQIGQTFVATPLMGNPGDGCTALANSVTSGSVLVGHSGAFDSGIGDLYIRSTNSSQ